MPDSDGAAEGATTPDSQPTEANPTPDSQPREAGPTPDSQSTEAGPPPDSQPAEGSPVAATAGAENTGIRVAAPIVFLAMLVAAFLIDWLVPLRVGLPGFLRWPLGLIMVVGPLTMMPFLFAAFRRAGSAYDVRKVPKALVTEGAFRYSRNPAYLGLIVFGFGLGILFDTAWLLVALIPFAGVIHFAVVLKEEELLAQKFGDAYRRYQRRVGRWI